MTLQVEELRNLIEHLRAQWLEHGLPAQKWVQPAARKDKPFEDSDIARIATVKGLARHVHETAAAVALLADHGHVNAMPPLVRQMYECALTAVWLMQSEDDHGIKAVIAEHARNRAAIQRDARRASSPVFRDGAEKVADTDVTPFADTFDSVRNFEGVCNDLTAEETDAYIVYRRLSTYSHAALEVVDLYFERTVPHRGYAPLSKRVPSEALGLHSLLHIAACAMVWSARAFTYSAKSDPYRSALRTAARKLEISAEVSLSDTYRMRHATKRRERRGSSS